MKKQEPSLQVKFSTNCGGDTRHRRVQWLSSPSQYVTGLFWWLSWQQAWRWWVCHLAKVLQCAYDESQGLLEAEPLAIFHRCGSDQFLFFFFFIFFYLQLLPETYLRAKGFHSRERQSYDSGVTVLVTEVPGRVEVNSLFSVQTEMSPPFGFWPLPVFGYLLEFVSSFISIRCVREHVCASECAAPGIVNIKNIKHLRVRIMSDFVNC